MPINFSNLRISLSELGLGRRSRVLRKFQPTWSCANLIAARVSAQGTNGSAVKVGFPKLPENSCLPSFNRNGAALFGALEAMVEQ
jgi:hypothetical protein